MGRLIYSIMSSLDGYIADEAGTFDWAVPDEEVLDFINDQELKVGTYLYGRTMYEMMTGWETEDSYAAQSPQSARFAGIWQAAEKIVYSTTLADVSTRHTGLRRAFDAEEIRQLLDGATADVNIAGPTLAAHAFTAGLVDEIQVIVAPVIVGGGTAFYPKARVPLVLRDTRTFGNSMVWLRYGVVRMAERAE
ncbi:dihydrofolate reductase [Arthrobacter sp. CAN_A212]|uniref:dihydrofolate reductase family protein n=1 Tax=unclassified Arthrobacter TaxID=235627 RepID=UPI0018CBAD74|nr:dihydrofolate reductase family protein [Arthrobacter sp. CAN_C5]MBP2216197.1 dihydrofolate reductase [Arthrobacter sp. CAN_C5]